ncbi:DICT sensory domain-containing protein [Haloplanus aerogenes]|uniref:DICT domain-containing protein n=1 Tax=Haloplanus aerogenes TaxID=660522 RepID=A0A3M0CY89_9EURY|nr:DICT sensory domain-containing protein [Haloplanus aerogenes]AZH26956.1 histidine kinase [Haloplanus aerogenes]RMB12609.1 DICT domain-containing protein [Haloplanus aerogenes]
MGLFELIATVDAEEKTLTVFNPEAGVATALREHFADRNLAIEEATSDAGPRNYAVLSRDDQFLAALDVSDVLGDRKGVAPGFTRETYEVVLDELDETMFTSYDTERMIAASKEIEDRAWRGASGELHAGFQTCSRFASQADVYDHIARRGSLDVHVYAHPEGSGDFESPAGPTLHLSTATEIHDTWFVAYDGGGVEAAKCALLAEERMPGSFYGFWTYDPETVDELVDHLRTTYAIPEADGRAADRGPDD